MLKSIQVLRAIAAMMVVAYHVLGEGEDSKSVLAAGVDIFFVISGFVMVVSTANRPVSFLTFMRARIKRVVPLYWFALGIAAAVIAFGPFEAPSIRELLEAYFFVPYVNPRNGLLAPLLVPGWTLNYEMFFYLLFGLTLFLGSRRQLLSLALIFATLVALRPVVGQYGAPLFRLTSPLLFEFLGGALLGYILPHRLQISPMQGLSLFIAGLLFAVVASRWAPWLPRTIGFGGPAVLIVAGCIASESIFTSSWWSPLVPLGNASYSIYLMHTFPLDFFERFLHLATPFQGVALFALAVSCSAPFYFIFERPMLKAMRKI